MYFKICAPCHVLIANACSAVTSCNHVAAVALYVAHYNLCRVHEALRATPAKALGVADRIWSIGLLVDAALVVAPALPIETSPDRRRKFTEIRGGRE
jgi:hypothetical protein